MKKQLNTVAERQAYRLSSYNNPKTERQKWIKKKMDEGWSYSKAQYAYGKMRDDKYYTPRNEAGLKYEDLSRNYYLDEDNNLRIKRSNKIKGKSRNIIRGNESFICCINKSKRKINNYRCFKRFRKIIQRKRKFNTNV